PDVLGGRRLVERARGPHPPGPRRHDRAGGARAARARDPRPAGHAADLRAGRRPGDPPGDAREVGSARTLGAVLAALGVSMTIFPFLPWYAADVPGRRITATGIEAAGEAWSVPILGLVVVVAGVAVAVQAVPSVAGARWVGLTAAAAGALAVAMV